MFWTQQGAGESARHWRPQGQGAGTCSLPLGKPGGTCPRSRSRQARAELSCTQSPFPRGGRHARPAGRRGGAEMTGFCTRPGRSGTAHGGGARLSLTPGPPAPRRVSEYGSRRGVRVARGRCRFCQVGGAAQDPGKVGPEEGGAGCETLREHSSAPHPHPRAFAPRVGPAGAPRASRHGAFLTAAPLPPWDRSRESQRHAGLAFLTPRRKRSDRKAARRTPRSARAHGPGPPSVQSACALLRTVPSALRGTRLKDS